MYSLILSRPAVSYISVQLFRVRLRISQSSLPTCELTIRYQSETPPFPSLRPPRPACLPSSQVVHNLQLSRQSFRSSTHHCRRCEARQLSRIDVRKRVKHRGQDRGLPQVRVAALQHSVAHEAEDKRDDGGRVSDPGPSRKIRSLACRVPFISCSPTWMGFRT